ncbi:hypothetical protein C5167_034839 [Papaver somniferum]|uniref:Auxin-responsive protein n=1 Tax=Papaver somniferum TaxID=3469 RepID=A0A4Y7KFJ3_PAPSO|nr:hypothetical protein C5167_034839 [Papaver somniferum]
MGETEGQGFELTELKLGMPGASSKKLAMEIVKTDKSKKRVFLEIIPDENSSSSTVEISSSTTVSDGKNNHENKIRIMGWPPGKRSRGVREQDDSLPKMYVKVSMDGAPYLRKVDLNIHKEYSDLAQVFDNIYGCFNSDSEYISIYEDKDGDWMLVGDVPYKMFIESCKRLRIMKRSDANCFGLQA